MSSFWEANSRRRSREIFLSRSFLSSPELRSYLPTGIYSSVLSQEKYESLWSLSIMKGVLPISFPVWSIQWFLVACKWWSPVLCDFLWPSVVLRLTKLNLAGISFCLVLSYRWPAQRNWTLVTKIRVFLEKTDGRSAGCEKPTSFGTHVSLPCFAEACCWSLSLINLIHVVTGRRGRRWKQLLDYLKERGGCCKLNEKTLDRTVENSIWERLCICRETHNRMNKWVTRSFSYKLKAVLWKVTASLPCL